MKSKRGLSFIYGLLRSLFLVALAFQSLGCTQSVSKVFVPLATFQEFDASTQGETAAFAGKVDVLFVIDNSGSMGSVQTILSQALNHFISLISGDSCFAVTTTAAYLANEKYRDTQDFVEPTSDITRTVMPRRWCTRNDDGTYVDLDQLKSDLRRAVYVGTSPEDGRRYERLYNGLLEFMYQNEAPAALNKLFRPNSKRVFIAISDEENQSVGYTSLNPLVISDPGSLSNSYHRNGPIDPNCNRSWQPSGFPNYIYGMNECSNFSVAPRLELAVMKSYLDNFFINLDGGNTSANPNYFFSLIAIKEWNTFHGLRKLARYGVTEADYQGVADRYVWYDRFDQGDELVNLIGNGSRFDDIGAVSFEPILSAVAQNTVVPVLVYTMPHNIDVSEPTYVEFYCRVNGATTPISQYTILGNLISIESSLMNPLLATCSQASLRVTYTPEDFSTP